MELTVISPKGVVCKEESWFVQLPGAAGRFTVLHNHAPLVSVLVEGEIRYQVDVELSDAETSAIVAFLHTLTGEYKGEKLTTLNEYGVEHTHDDDHDHE